MIRGDESFIATPYGPSFYWFNLSFRSQARAPGTCCAENTIDFDPGRNPADLAVLREMVRKKQ